jgi:hypothetical protein
MSDGECIMMIYRIAGLQMCRIWKGRCRDSFEYAIKKYSKYKDDPFCMPYNNACHFGVSENARCRFARFWSFETLFTPNNRNPAN